MISRSIGCGANRSPEGRVGCCPMTSATAAALGAAGEVRAGVGAAGEDRVGVRGGPVRTRTRCRELGSRRTTVGKWRRRFVEHRLDGLGRRAPAGRPRTITDEQVEEVIITTLERKPANATHWSRGRWPRAGMSQSTIGRIWRAFGLKPHLVDTFKLSTDPLFIEKVRDVVGLYLDPPDRRWCCAWTRSPRCRPWTGPRRCCR